MKLVISKNKDGNGYYTKIINDYNGERQEMYFPITLSKNVGELDYALYEVDGFLSCYKTKDGETKPKLVITSAKPTKKYEDKKEELPTNQTGEEVTQSEEYDPFSEFGESIEIDDQFLE